MEVAYGGLVTNVRRTKVSPFDTRSSDELAFGGMTGGDRMLHNAYASVYAAYLCRFLEEGRGIVLTEFGILKGTGLAIWCDLFPSSRIVGFDIDLSHFEENRAYLIEHGAFKCNVPEVYEYDQLVDGSKRLEEVLKGDRLDVVIDDGLHSLDAIRTTWRSARPFLSRRFVYFCEDYAGLADVCGPLFDGFDVRAFGMLTVVSSGVPVPSGLCSESWSK